MMKLKKLGIVAGLSLALVACGGEMQMKVVRKVNQMAM